MSSRPEWPSDALSVPCSPEELAQLSWQQFELFALRVISRMYEAPGVQFEHTPFSHDGGRDGDAQYVLGVGLDTSLEITFRIWLEVKKRGKEHVGKGDLGSHLIDASLQGAHTIIFVTNSEFSANLGDWLASYSRRTGVQHKLIDGQELLAQAGRLLVDNSTVTESARSVELPPALPRPRVQATCWFSLSPFDQRTRLAPHPVVGRNGRPVYLNVELAIDRASPSFAGSLKVCTNRSSAADCHPHAGSSVGPRLFSASDVATLVYDFWPNDRRWSASDFGFTMESAAEVHLEARFLNDLELEYLSLPDTPLASQREVGVGLLAKVGNLRPRELSGLTLLIAPPGAGKSHLVNKLRRELTLAGRREIYIDCETVRDERALFTRVLLELLPLPAGAALGIDLRRAVANWCAAVGLSMTAAAEVADDLCFESDADSHIAPRRRAELLAMVLGEKAIDGLTVVVEDLHKAMPSLLSSLLQLIGELGTTGRGSVRFVLSTRPYSSDTGEVRSEWLSRLDELSRSEQVRILVMTQPSAGDAVGLLEAGVLGLERYHAEIIVQAIGTAPYDLREGLLFLLATRSLRLSEGTDGPPLTVSNPVLLERVIASPKLQQMTERRLQVLLRNQPAWLEQFLLAGAAFGRSFPVEAVAAAVADAASPDAIDRAIATCGLWSVAALSAEQNDWLDFNHDLIRETLLRTAPPRSRMRAAAALFAQVEADGGAALLARLAYQAGLAETALGHARTASAAAKHDERLDDVVELNQLAIQALDPSLDALALPIEGDDGVHVDAAVRYARRCRVPGLSTQQRHGAVLDLLVESLSCLSSLAAGSGALSERMLSEAALLANRLGDDKTRARLLVMEGHLRFERNEVASAVAVHRAADALYATLGLDREKGRAENLIRLAICERSLGNTAASLSRLAEATKACPRGDWRVLNKIRNNTGAVFLKSDWRAVRRHWLKQMAQAERRGLTNRLAHGLISLAFIDLFEGDLESGVGRTTRALAIADRLHLDNQKVRGALNMSVYCIQTRDYDGALEWLRLGERTALSHRIGRRLWRVVANLATVYELLKQTALCRVRERQVSELLNASPVAPSGGARGADIGGRQLLPLVNIILRRGVTRSEEHDDLMLPAKAYDYAELVRTGRIRELPNLLGRYCVELEVGPRFLLTE